MITNQSYNLRVSLRNSLGGEFIINPENVLSLTISESVLGILPKFEMVITDKGTFIENYPIVDKTTMYITLDNVVDDTPIINAEFIISTFFVTSDVYQNQYVQLNIAGYFASRDMLSPFHRQAYKGSSDDVLRNMSTEVNMVFDGRVRGVEDNIWYQSGNNFQFINHVADRAFVDDDGVFVYGDVNGNLIYTSYKTELSKNRKFVGTYDRLKVEQNILLESESNIMYYDGYNILNATEMYNNVAVYGGQYSYYNMTNYIYNTTSLNSKSTDYYNQNKEYAGRGAFSIGVGLLPDESFFETIYKGKIQNAFYKYAMFSNTIMLNVNNCTKARLFDKVELNLLSTLTRNDISDTYSGEYLIGGITYNITRDRPLEKQVMLCRYGMNDVVFDNRNTLRNII